MLDEEKLESFSIFVNREGFRLTKTLVLDPVSEGKPNYSYCELRAISYELR